VTFPLCGDRVLLLRHAEGGDRFRGLWNGVGGHVEAGEDPHSAALRELREEAGVVPESARLRAVVHETGLLGHAYVLFFFLAEVRDRKTRPAPGVDLCWQPLDRIGDLPLVHDVAELLPRMLAAREPLFVTERYDGGDRRLSLRIAGEAAHGAARA